jgi:site-specific DNA-methyltransferase (adenine-specific)
VDTRASRPAAPAAGRFVFAGRRTIRFMTAATNDARVIEGDCLDVLAAMPAGSASLVYADPPFATGTRRRGRRRGGDDGERDDDVADLGYDDHWPSLDAFLEFLDARLRAVHRVLADDGAVLVHVDWRSSHRVRLMLDEIFGPDRFVNHLVWQYGLGGSAPDRFARKHDDILYYARGETRWFEPPMVPATSQRLKGRMKKATDVLDIPSINNMSHERTGWPDQKPLALLDLLVRACCPPDGLVIDPFCGSGTTLVAAIGAGRRAIGIDRHPDAVRLARGRLRLTPSARAGEQESR